MANIKGLCFDLFNTLVDVGSVPASVGAYTADILGIDRQVWRDACFGMAHQITRPVDGYECMKALVDSIDATIPEQKIREALQAREERFEYALLNIDERLLTALSRLEQAGFKLALVSNASSSEVQAWERSPLIRYFETSVFSCYVGSRKPDAGIYQAALSLLGLSASECLFIGDGGSDEHLGAAAIGLAPVLLTHYLEPENLPAIRAQYQSVLIAELDSIEALLNFLELG
ncbi:MAG: HAD family hydrolase [Gammaproteobacteria bacterium]|nr:HAD family hydrolase [Gammaproteobacteria bacterium]